MILRYQLTASGSKSLPLTLYSGKLASPSLVIVTRVKHDTEEVLKGHTECNLVVDLIISLSHYLRLLRS